MINEPITLLGAGGFIGRHLLQHWQAASQVVYAPARGDDAVFHRPLGHVVYAIGLTSDFRSRPLETVEAHVCVLRQLLAHADFSSLTYLSSTRVYAGAASTNESARLVVSPEDPSDLYNISKLMGESLCLHSGRAGMKVARLSNVVGIRPDPDIFIDQLLEEGMRTGRVQLRTSLQSRKDYLHIDDAVAMIAALAVAPDSGIFNVASGEATSNQTVADALRQYMRFDVSVLPDAPTWDFMAINMARTHSRFGLKAQPFDNHFPKFLTQYRQQRRLHALS